MQGLIKKLLLIQKYIIPFMKQKMALGPAPFKTKHGWLHLAHGVRNTAAGLRYVLYMFMTDLHDLTKVIYKPAGYFMAPEGEERMGDVSNVLFSNGWILDDDGTVFIYYASSDTRMHVATSTIDQLLDYVMNTAEDNFSCAASVKTLNHIIDNNLKNNKEGVKAGQLKRNTHINNHLECRHYFQWVMPFLSK